MVNRKMQKTFSIGLTAAMALTLAACGNSNNNSNNNSGGDNAAPKSTNSAAEATKDSGKKVTITFQNIYPDPATPAYKMIRELVGNMKKKIQTFILNWIL